MQDPDSSTLDENDAYKKSILFKKLLQRKKINKPLKIAFLDIDSTLTGEEKVIEQTRKQLKKLGYQVVFVTARTEEMVMSKIDYEKSCLLGFNRPKPLMNLKNNTYSYKDPAEINPDLVNPDIIIGSTGTQILIRQINSGYMVDSSFDKQFGVNNNQWRKEIKEIILKSDVHKKIHFALFEDEKAYINNQIDIYPPNFRIKLLFNNINDKKSFILSLKRNIETSQINHATASTITGIRIIDESNTHKNKYAIYITPALGNKGNAVNYVVKQICTNLEQYSVQQKDLQVILAGDSFPDLAMLFYGAKGTNATAILVGGSRLANILINKEIDEYAGEDLSIFKDNMEKQKDKNGFFYFTHKDLMKRKIVIGDIAYPNTKGPATLLAYLTQTFKN